MSGRIVRRLRPPEPPASEQPQSPAFSNSHFLPKNVRAGHGGEWPKPSRDYMGAGCFPHGPLRRPEQAAGGGWLPSLERPARSPSVEARTFFRKSQGASPAADIRLSEIMRVENLCNRCLSGVLFIQASRQVGPNSQQQYWRCPICKRHQTKVVPRDTIKPRRRLKQLPQHSLVESP